VNPWTPCKPRTTDLRPWLWGETLRGSPEPSSPYSRAGRSVVRGKRREFVRRLRKVGFDGPYSGTQHHFMVYQQHRLAIPSNTEYSVPQLRMMLREVEEIINRNITVEFWDRL